MELTDSKREEFKRLAADTYDPELWLEDDLPLLRAIKRECLEEQEREHGDALPPGRMRTTMRTTKATGRTRATLPTMRKWRNATGQLTHKSR